MNPRLFLTTPRLTLRLPHPEDVRTVHHAIETSLPELRQWFPSAIHGQTQKQTRDYIYTQMALWVQDEVFMWGIFNTISGQCVGVVDFTRRVPRIPSYEVGFWTRSDLAGQGYMAEALSAATHWAFAVLKAQRVFLRCEPANTPCQRTAERAGYLREAWLKNDALSVNGRNVVDTLIYAHTPASWSTWQARLTGATA